MTNFWDDNLSEHDLMSEEIEEQAQKILEEYEEPEEIEEEYEEYEEEYEEEVMQDYRPSSKKAAYKLNKGEDSIVANAMVKLEQARLYEMLIKHDMFKGVKANPTALANVKRELKDYILSRLEKLLAINSGKEEPKQPVRVEVESPFNDVEIEFLKALSYKGTKGLSAEAGTKKITATEIQPLQSSQKVKEEPQGLSSLGDYDNQTEPYEEEEEYVEPAPVRKPKKVAKPAPKRKKAQKAKPKVKPSPSQPVKKNKPSRAKINRRGEISDSEAERIAREDIERMKGRKPVNKMTATELIEANKKITTANKARPAGAKPIPTAQQLNLQYQTQQLQNSQNPNSNGFNLLLNKVLASKK